MQEQTSQSSFGVNEYKRAVFLVTKEIRPFCESFVCRCVL